MLEIIGTLSTWLHVLSCLFLILVVLVQPGKSGGMGALSGAAATQVFGGRGAGNLLTKTTWITATIFFSTSLTLAFLSSSTTDSLEGKANASIAPAPKKSDSK